MCTKNSLKRKTVFECIYACMMGVDWIACGLIQETLVEEHNRVSSRANLRNQSLNLNVVILTVIDSMS